MWIQSGIIRPDLKHKSVGLIYETGLLQEVLTWLIGLDLDLLTNMSQNVIQKYVQRFPGEENPEIVQHCREVRLEA